jgi:nicotinamide-nucleotide amidase
MKPEPMRCQLLMTGNELMTGVTIDSNSALIAEQLHSISIAVQKKVTVGDALPDLEREIREACTHSQLLIINGGLGPTDDDLTAQALANVSRQPLQINPVAEQHVQRWCASRGMAVNAANLKQTFLPRGAEVIANHSGSAVGIRMKIEQCLVLCTPGVPSEIRLMLQREILPWLQQQFPDCQQQFIKRLQVFGLGESTIQQKVHNELPDWPKEIELGFRAGFPTLEVKLTAHNRAHLPQRDTCEQQLRALLGAQCFGEENESLPSVIIAALKQRHQKITTAESCTGGLIAAQITAIAGASQVFEAGFVTYSNDSKQRELGVDAKTLNTVGAVSEETVRQMAQGALQKSGADYVIAVSGIAGPDGGTADKPVGTVWIAWGKRDQIRTRKLFYPAERKMFQNLVAAYGLDLIRRVILDIKETPRYFR